MRELDYKESWAPKNWYFWTVVLEKTLERVPWTARRSNQSLLKEISPGYSLVGLILKLKRQYFWPPDINMWLNWKDPDAGEDWGQEEKGTTEDKMVGWHHWLNGQGFGWTLGVGDGQGGLACCGSRGRKESDTTEQLNWTERLTNYLVHLVPGWLSLSTSADKLAIDCTATHSPSLSNMPLLSMCCLI